METTLEAPRSVHELKLYEITAELDNVVSELIETGGVLTPEIEALLDALEGALEAKVERTALVIRQIEAQAESARVESRRLADLASARAASAKRLKEYVMFNMAEADVRKIEGKLVNVSICKNSRPSIKWTGTEEELPDLFRRVRVDADTDAAYKEFKSGGVLPDGFEIKHGEHLRIK